MPEPVVEEKPRMARHARVGEVLHEETLWELQLLIDSEWVSMGAFKSDRDELQRVQDFHAKAHPEDRRRVVKAHTTYTLVEIEKPRRAPRPRKKPVKKETSG